MRVDRVREIAYLDAATIEGAAALSPGLDYIVGVIKLPDGIALIHDLARFLSAAESTQLDAALYAVGEAASAP